MKQEYHTLNGDALKAQFPSQIKGDIIIARECLVDGDVNGSTPEEIYATRAKFISGAYDGYTEQDYYKKTVPEFEKIRQIPKHSEINLWFEDDLFCQVNLWFVLYLLQDKFESSQVYLVRPTPAKEFGFGGMNEAELIEAFEKRIRIEYAEYNELKKLWKYYQNSDFEGLMEIAEKYKVQFPFLRPAVQAHIERFPEDGSLGRPEQSLLSIMRELQTDQFAPVFREFCKRENIYGFGDLQVKRMWDINKNNIT